MFAGQQCPGFCRPEVSGALAVRGVRGSACRPVASEALMDIGARDLVRYEEKGFGETLSGALDLIATRRG